jgi:NAD(P)-dependent dehydrogenase (short-subunit alcohol dehydrogenase family)
MNSDNARSVLITGASRGIGAACAIGCAKAGWDVAVNYTRDASAAERVAREVRALGRRAIHVQADVADEPAVLAMFERVDAELPPLQGLVTTPVSSTRWRASIKPAWRACSACSRSMSSARLSARVKRSSA